MTEQELRQDTPKGCFGCKVADPHFRWIGVDMVITCRKHPEFITCCRQSIPEKYQCGERE